MVQARSSSSSSAGAFSSPPPAVPLCCCALLAFVAAAATAAAVWSSLAQGLNLALPEVPHAVRLRRVPRHAPPECATPCASGVCPQERLREKEREREHFVKSVSVHCAHVVLCLVLAVASVCSQGHQGRPSFVVVVSPSPSFPRHHLFRRHHSPKHSRCRRRVTPRLSSSPSSARRLCRRVALIITR